MAEDSFRSLNESVEKPDKILFPISEKIKADTSVKKKNMHLNDLQPFTDIFNPEKEATLKIKECIGEGNHSHASVKH